MIGTNQLFWSNFFATESMGGRQAKLEPGEEENGPAFQIVFTQQFLETFGSKKTAEDGTRVQIATERPDGKPLSQRELLKPFRQSIADLETQLKQYKQAEIRREADSAATTAAKLKELQKRDYRAPIRRLECMDQRNSVTQCYQDNKEDVLRCSAFVAALANCAEEARRAALHKEHSRGP